jgi:hypothetical protein
MHLARRGPRALRAGFLAFVMTQLGVAVLALPWLSVHSDVAHAHPEGTEPHVHPLGDLFAAGPIAAPVQRVSIDLGAVSAPLPATVRSAPSAPPSTIHGARAPPALTA